MMFFYGVVKLSNVHNHIYKQKKGHQQKNLHKGQFFFSFFVNFGQFKLSYTSKRYVLQKKRGEKENTLKKIGIFLKRTTKYFHYVHLSNICLFRIRISKSIPIIYREQFNFVFYSYHKVIKIVLETG